MNKPQKKHKKICKNCEKSRPFESFLVCKKCSTESCLLCMWECDKCKLAYCYGETNCIEFGSSYCEKCNHNICEFCIDNGICSQHVLI